MNWFKQAVTGQDNKTFEGAYLALAAIIGLVAFVVLNLLTMAWIDLFSDYENNFNYAGLGGGIAAIIGALAGFLAGVGSYILMDRKGQAATDSAPASTTTEQTTKTVTTQPAADPATLVDAGRGVEPLSPSIKPADVGKSVALVSRRKRKKRKSTKGATR